MPSRSKPVMCSMKTRTPRTPRTRWMVLILMMGTYVPCARGLLLDPSDHRPHPLSLKEEMIRDRFRRFEDRVYRLREKISESEPENATKLDRVLQRAGELGLADQLEDVMGLLRDPSMFSRAMDAQIEWLADADRLLAILLERDSDNDTRREELQRLREHHKELGQLLEKEKSIRDETAQTGLSQRMMEQIKQALQRVEALQKAQSELSKPSGQPAGAEQQAQAQEALSREAQRLAEDLEQMGLQKPQEDADSPSMESAREHTTAAAEAMKQSAQQMGQASEQLESGDPSSAQPQQQSAEEALEKAKAELEKAKEQLEDAQSEQEIAEKQQKVAEQTEALSQKMQQKQQGGQQQGQQAQQQEGKPSQGSPTPGQESVDRAQQEMRQAQQQLQESSPQKATENQDRAIEELEQAQKELEEAMQQIRKEQREETLRDLEGRFREMLTKQKAIFDATVGFYGIGVEYFQRADRLEVAEVATNQRKLSEDANSCLHILDEDGTTIVFPRVVGQIAADMMSVADRLNELKVGLLTQTIEEEIIDALTQLLEAVEKMQQENEQDDSDGGQSESGEGDSPLLPESAELKLLRASQFRVNTRTEALDLAQREGSETREELDDVFKSVSHRQKQCAQTAEEMRDLLNKP